MIGLSSLKALLDIEQSDTTYDDLLVDMEDEAVAYIERATGRYFRGVAEVAIPLRGEGGTRLYLPEIPVGDPSAMVEVQYPGATETDLAVSTDYIVRSNGSGAWLERANGSVWENGYTYTLTYERGYEAGSEPPEVRRAVKDLVRLWFRSRSTAGAGSVRSETIGGYSYTLDGADGSENAVPSVRDVIAMWRHPVLA